MAEIVHFKTIKARSPQRRAAGADHKANLRHPNLRSPSTLRTVVDAAKRNPRATRFAVALLKTAVIPLVILLCSIVACAMVVEHVSGQPAYSARSNISAVAADFLR